MSSQYKVRIVTPLTIMDYDEAILTDIKKSGEREDGFLYDFKEKTEGKLTFDKSKYKEFELIDKSQLRYVPMYMTVWEICNGTQNQVLYGKLSLLEAEFDGDKCVIKIKVTSDNKYLKYEQHKGDTYNLLNALDFGYYPKVTVQHPSITGTIKNGIKLLHALEGLWKKINPFGNVISNFLSTGGYGNYVCGDTAIFQKSDVIRRNVSSVASKMEWTLEKLITNTCQQFNLLWKIDDYGNLLIDDIYYFEYGIATIKDLTVTPYIEQIGGKNQWKYQKEKVFKKELYINPNSVNKDFIGEPIVYDNALVNSMDKNAEKKITQDFITDVAFLCTIDPNDESTDYNGTVLISYYQPSPTFVNTIMDTNFFGGVLLDPIIKPNNNLSWACLHPYRFKDYGRFFATGKMNGVATNFTNIMRTKLQSALVFKLCCGDTFDAGSYFKTELGVGKLDKYKITFGKKTVDIDILFEPQDNLSFVLPYLYPYTACMAMGSNINSAINGYGTLLSFSPANPNLVVLAETKPTYFGGTVQIFSNGHYIYNPPTGVFIGQDFFEFIVTDTSTTYNAVSTATITVQYPNIFVKEKVTNMYPYVPQQCATKVELFWYKDAGGTQPLDVTGYCFDVYKKDGSNNPVGTVPPNGYSQVIFDYYCGTEEYVDVSPVNAYTII